jgi:ribosomal protein S18 acetylase RimI-like enzyme
MTHTKRLYQGEDDYWRIRDFLRRVFWLNGRRELSWQVARLDYWRWHCIENCQMLESMEDVIYIWETDGQITAVLNPEWMGEAYFQVHPGARTRELEEEMLTVAEEHLAVSNGNGHKKLTVWAHESDSLRPDILTQHGYTRGDWPEYERRRSLAVPIPDAPPAPGYTVRSLGGIEELPSRSWASWRAFHPDEPDENYEGWEWYHNIQRTPMYRRDLDIVAAAPTGEIAGFCTIWYDDVTRNGFFEPVGVVPEHQRRGLGKAVMCEGLRRLKRMGADMATVGGFSVEANALYASVMSPEYELFTRWNKEF